MIEAGLGGCGGVGFAEVAGEGLRHGAERVLELLAGLTGTELRISFWWTAVRRVRSVCAMEMPIEPPTLRMRLKRPLALPICLLSSVP